MRQFTKTVSIKAVDEEARTATGAVLIADELDHQGDFFRADAIERFHNPDPDTGVMHAAFPDAAAEFERLEVIEDPESVDGEEFPAGTLIGTRKYHDDDLWQLVADGVLTGFSIGGDIAEANEHDDIPDDVRVPDDVDDELITMPVTELVDGTINEVSDVDIPAVPRATYKGDELGKSILEEVDGEAGFVAVMTEQRGHTEDEARRLYQYLTDARARDEVHDTAEKPIVLPNGAEFETFDACVREISGDGTSEEQARRICGAGHERVKVDINGTEVDLTPPPRVVNAASEGLAAKEEYDDIADCGTGVGESMADRIINAELTPEILLDGGDVAQNDPETYLTGHESDLDAAGTPSEWSEDDWTGGCAEVQQALWGFYPEWFAGLKAEIRDTMEDDTQAMQKFDYEPGTFVSWNASGGRAMGQIVDRTEDGQFNQAISGDQTVEGSEEEPAYLIEVYEGRGQDAEPMDEESGRGDTMHVGHRESELREVDDPREQAASKGGVFAWLRKRFGTSDPDSGSDDGASPEALGSVATEKQDIPIPEDAQLLYPTVEQAATVAREMGLGTEDDADADITHSHQFEGEEWHMPGAIHAEFEEAIDEEAAKHAPGGDTPDDSMSNDTDKSDEPPAWADDLRKKVEQIEARVETVETGGGEEKSLKDAPEWAADLAAKVDDLDERVESISKQSGRSQQLGKTGGDAEETEKTSGFTLDPRATGGRR